MPELWRSLNRSLTKFKSSVIESGQNSSTFEEISERSARFSESMGSVLPVERSPVLLAGKNSIELVVAFLGLLGANAVPVLCDPALQLDQLEQLANQIGSQVLLRSEAPDDGSWYELESFFIRSIPAQRLVHMGSETEVCRLSSGSTRSAACIEFDARAVLAAANTWASHCEYGPNTSILNYAGIYNGLAFNTTLVPGILSGANIHIPSAQPAGRSLTATINRIQPEFLIGFPAMFEMLARQLSRSSDLFDEWMPKAMISSSVPLDRAKIAPVERVFGAVADYYGIAECGPVTSPLSPNGRDQGFPLPGAEVRVQKDPSGADVLYVKTESMASRYTNYPGELEGRITADGFYRTSDVVAINDGRIKVSGRVGRQINLYGHKFMPEMIEESISELCPHARGVYVFVTEESQPRLVCMVEGVAGCLDEEMVRSELSSRIQSYQIPSVFMLVDNLPRGGAGKVSLDGVRSLYESFSSVGK